MAKAKKILPNKVISGLFFAVFRWYLGSLFSLNLEKNDTVGLTPPYLVIANHANFWDGVLVNLFIKDPICFLVSDEYFRKPFLGWLLRIEGSIPKKKFLSDFTAIKDTLTAKAAGRIIGIFPEGKRNWDGSTEKVIFATAKLIKMLNIPVVRALLKGSYLTFPRWARYKKKGKIFLSYDLVLAQDKIRQLSVENIYREITESLSYQEYDYQKTAMNIYQGKDLAEKLELFLFLCPHCHQIGSLYSRSDILTCRDCGYQVKYTEHGFLHAEKEPLYFDNPADWNQWQINWSQNFLKKNFEDEGQKILIQDKGVNLTMIEQEKRIHSERGCQLSLQDKELILETNRLGTLYFDLTLIKGINVQYNDHFEFYYKGQLYQFHFDDPSISAYKWYTIVKLIQNMIS
jgi:1-acyl-sn-glycerol-3-phosphate acyltransferase